MGVSQVIDGDAEPATPEPFYFGIPLRPRARSRDWDRVVTHLRATLSSCLNQSDPDFRILIACNERPDVQSDQRIEFVHVDADAPGYPQESMLDKGRKLSAIGCRIRELGGGAIMLSDADDLVHRDVVRHARSRPQAAALIADRGYDLADPQRGLIPAPWFDRSCGTCAVLRQQPAELPSTLDEPEPEARFLIRAGHHQWRPRLRVAGARIEGFPFPVAVHVLSTGENQSILRQDIGWKRWLMRTLIPATRITDQLRADYCLDSLPAAPASGRR